MLEFREFSSQEREAPEEDLEKLRKVLLERKFSEENILGISEQNGVFYASHWVGVTWIKEGELAVRVKPKHSEGIESSVEVKMLERCLQSPQVAERLLGRTGVEAERGEIAFFFWPEQKPMNVGREVASTAYLFLIAEFLYELKKLCERHLKRQFPRVDENLAGKVKGRILVGENFRRNFVCGRSDRVYCQFQTHSLDIKENQILKAALEVSLSYLNYRRLNLKALWTKGQFCRNALAEVSFRRIFPRDFSGLRLTGTMKHYRRPVELAKIILQRIAYEPNPSKFEQENVTVFPYAIDMNQLFERYCEALLRSGGIDGIEPEYGTLWAGSEDLVAGRVYVRPDFLFAEKGEPVVADAKYKYGWKPNDHREDVYQVIAYTCHRGVHEKLGKLCNKEMVEPIKIYIFYPETQKSERLSIAGFQKLEQGQQQEKEIISVPVFLLHN